MVGENVHQDIEHQNVAGHEEDQKQQLAETQQLTTEAAHEKLTGISHAVNLRVAQFELANLIARVP